MANPFFLTTVLSLALLAPAAMLHDCGNPMDADGDGYAADVDCDDSDADINPGAIEPCECNGIDENCNDVIDDFPCDFPVCDDVDMDGDGYGASVDCDDQDPAIHPDQEEPCVCNDIDENCNGIQNDFPCDIACPVEPGGVGDACGGEFGSCQRGLVCCYPCGIEGCPNNVCFEPCFEDWCAGGCPLFP